MKHISLFLLIIGMTLQYFVSFSQGWEKSYGGAKDDIAYDVIKTSDGGFIAVGSTQSFGAGGTDVFVVKISGSGYLKWTRVIGGTANDIAYSVSETSTGELVIAGATSSFGAGGSDVYLIKLSANGTTQWTRTFGGTDYDEAHSVIVSGSDIYVAGFKSQTYFNTDFYFLKISSGSGYASWEKTYSTPGSYTDDKAYSVVKTFDGGFALAGETECCDKVYLVKTDANGQVLFTKSFDQGTGSPGATGIVETSDHSLVMTGVNYSGGDKHLFLLKVNSTGNLVYSHVTSALVNSVTNLAIANNGKLLAGANYCNIGCNMELLKYDATGAEVWHKSDYQLANYSAYGTFSGVKAVKILSGNSYIACGNTYLPPGSQSDFLIVKTDSSGKSYTHPVLSYSGPTVFCDSDSVTITAPTGYTSYQWTYVDTNHDLDYIAGATSSVYTATSTGYYSCIMKTAMNDVNVAIADYVIKSSTPIITLSGPASFCTASGETLQLNIVQEPGSSYHWQLNGTNIVGATDTSYSPTASGNYTVVRTNSCGTMTSAPIVVNVAAPPATPVVFDNYYISEVQCNGITDTIYNDGNLTVSEVTGATYQWYHNGISISGATDFYTFPYYNDDDYTCTVTNNCGSATSAPFPGAHEIYNEVSPIPFASGPATGCGVSSVTLSVNTYDPYQWYNNGSIIPGATDASYHVTSSGNYHCEYYSATCGTFQTQVQHVDITSYPTPSMSAAGPTFICTGTVTLNATPIGAGTSYEWYMDNVVIPGATASTYAAPATGNYKCLVTQPCGSQFTNGIYVSIGVAANNTINANATTICSSVFATLTVNNPVAGETFQWRRNGINLVGATLYNYKTHVAGTYDCKITNSCGTVVSNPISITVNSTPVATITGNTTFCSGNSVTLTGHCGTAVSWAWFRGAYDTGDTQSSCVAIYGGDYKVLVTDVNGCTSFSNVLTVTSVSKPFAAIAYSEYPDICSGGSTTMKSNSANGYSYQWKKNNVIIAGATSNSYTASVQGSYSVKVTNMCGSTTAYALPKVRVKNLPPANITPQGPTSFCNGGNVVLAVGSGTNYDYSWKKNEIVINGATSSSYTATTEGTYKVVVTSNNGCTNVSAGTVVTVPCKEGETISAEAANDIKVSIYPNPYNESFVLYIEGDDNIEYTFSIMDYTGKAVSENEKILPGNEIQLGENLAPGYYLINVASGNLKKTLKVVKL